MRRILSALILSTALSASAYAADSAGTAAAPAADPNEPLPGTIAATNKALSKDLHETRSDSYKNTGKRKDIVPLRQKLNAAEYGKMLKDRKRDEKNDNSSEIKSNSSDGSFTGSNVGAVPAAGAVAGEHNPNPKDPPLVEKAPPAAVVMPKLPVPPATPETLAKPLPSSPELRTLQTTDAKTPPSVAAELSDGTQALFQPNGNVTLVSPTGKYRIPPDGVLTLKDGTSFTIENGMRVDK